MGQRVLNKTNHYLSQSLLEYDIETPEEKLGAKFSKIKTGLIGFFIGYKKLDLNDVLYVVIDITRIKNLDESLEYLKTHSAFKDDYPIGESLEKYHIIEFFIHKRFKGIVEKFVKGKYSELYPDVKTISQLFSHSATIFDVLVKSEKLKQKIEEDLNVILDSDAELESIPILKEEIYDIQPE